MGHHLQQDLLRGIERAPVGARLAGRLAGHRFATPVDRDRRVAVLRPPDHRPGLRDLAAAVQLHDARQPSFALLRIGMEGPHHRLAAFESADDISQPPHDDAVLLVFLHDRHLQRLLGGIEGRVEFLDAHRDLPFFQRRQGLRGERESQTEGREKETGEDHRERERTSPPPGLDQISEGWGLPVTAGMRVGCAEPVCEP